MLHLLLRSPLALDTEAMEAARGSPRLGNGVSGTPSILSPVASRLCTSGRRPCVQTVNGGAEIYNEDQQAIYKLLSGRIKSENVPENKDGSDDDDDEDEDDEGGDDDDDAEEDFSGEEDGGDDDDEDDDPEANGEGGSDDDDDDDDGDEDGDDDDEDDEDDEDEEDEDDEDQPPSKKKK